MKHYALGTCLFTFLFVVLGGGLHLNPGGAFLAALSGTPLVIHVFNRWLNDQTGERDFAARGDTQRVVHGQASRSEDGAHIPRSPTDDGGSPVSSAEE